MEKKIYRLIVAPDQAGQVSDFLSAQTGLSKTRVKEAMNKGAVWVRKSTGGPRRLRKATALLKPGYCIELYYDEKVLSAQAPAAKCLSDQVSYSVWYKPAGLLSQGTMYGDHCSVMRQAEIWFASKREVFLVHRLDREVPGLMLLGHSKDAAARLSALFRDNRILKGYRAVVFGDPSQTAAGGRIDQPLDGKPSVTEFVVESYNGEDKTSTVRVFIKTGRLHQIRRHFEMIGHPVIGDPKYGRGNKNSGGMQLKAVSLGFICPYKKKEMEFRVEE